MSVGRRALVPPLLLALAGCGLEPLGPMVRIAGGAPAGEGADPAAQPQVDFTGPLDPRGILDGRRVLLAPAAELRAALAAVESEEGAAAGPPFVAADAALEAGGTRVRLRPSGPLAAGRAFAVVVSSRLLGADGRHVLDVDGRLRPWVLQFTTAAPPPPAVLLTEVLADAETPEAGGEYVEVLNLGPGPLDLTGWRLEKLGTTGAWSGCTVDAPIGEPALPGGVGLLVGGSWDGRYDVPGGVLLAPCGATAIAGGIANDRSPVLRLLAPGGMEADRLDATGTAPCAQALTRDPEAPERLACVEGSPGWLP